VKRRPLRARPPWRARGSRCRRSPDRRHLRGDLRVRPDGVAVDSDPRQSRHSVPSRAASQGLISTSGSLGGSGTEQAAVHPDVKPGAGQVGEEVVGGGRQRLVGHRVERVEDEQRRRGLLPQLRAPCLPPVPAPAGHPTVSRQLTSLGSGVVGLRRARRRVERRYLPVGGQPGRVLLSRAACRVRWSRSRRLDACLAASA
jgi:hypothetical protein